MSRKKMALAAVAAAAFAVTANAYFYGSLFDFLHSDCDGQDWQEVHAMNVNQIAELTRENFLLQDENDRIVELTERCIAAGEGLKEMLP